MIKKQFTLLYLACAVFLLFIFFATDAECKKTMTTDDYLISGQKSYNGKNYESAIASFYSAYKKSEDGSEEKETAQFYLGKSFMAMGLTYASTEFFYEIIKSGSNIDRIIDSLYEIQKLVESGPHDQDLVKSDLIYNMEYAFLPGDLLDFSNYYKGEVNFKKKLYKWANKRFSLISLNSYYFNKLKFLKGIQILALNRVDEALKIFQDIIEDQFQDFNIKNKARQTVARLLYEKGKYKEAYDLYVQIDTNILEQDSVFLEKAWSLFFLKRYQEALGALNSLWTPLSKERFFYPEKYVLKCLILRALCQYDEAKRAIVAFQNEYGESIETILNRDDPFKNAVLTNAAMWNTEIKGKSQFMEQLKYEKRKAQGASGSWQEAGLKAFLQKIYDLKIDEVLKLIENEMLDRFKEVSNTLLDYYEQMRIFEYELSLDELSRLKKPPLDIEPVEKIPLFFKGKIYWPFTGEYWTDELLLYKHLIQNKCGRRG